MPPIYVQGLDSRFDCVSAYFFVWPCSFQVSLATRFVHLISLMCLNELFHFLCMSNEMQQRCQGRHQRPKRQINTEET